MKKLFILFCSVFLMGCVVLTYHLQHETNHSESTNDACHIAAIDHNAIKVSLPKNQYMYLDTDQLIIIKDDQTIRLDQISVDEPCNITFLNEKPTVLELLKN